MKNPPASAGDAGSIPGSGRSPRIGNGNPPQYSSLGNSMDGGAWHATVHGVTESQTRLKQLSIAYTETYMKGSEKAMAPHSSTLAWKIHGRRSLVGCSPWGR